MHPLASWRINDLWDGLGGMWVRSPKGQYICSSTPKVSINMASFVPCWEMYYLCARAAAGWNWGARTAPSWLIHTSHKSNPTQPYLWRSAPHLSSCAVQFTAAKKVDFNPRLDESSRFKSKWKKCIFFRKFELLVTKKCSMEGLELKKQKKTEKEFDIQDENAWTTSHFLWSEPEGRERKKKMSLLVLLLSKRELKKEKRPFLSELSIKRRKKDQEA